MKNLTELINKKKKDKKEKKELYLVNLYKIDENFYKEFLEYAEFYPKEYISQYILNPDNDMLTNIRNMSKKNVGRYAVYFSKGIFREYITDIPLTGIKEYADINPNNKNTLLTPVVYGEEEPLFFSFMDSKDIFDYGLRDFGDRILKPMSEEEKMYYLKANNNFDVLKDEIRRLKIYAKRDYYNALIDSIDIANQSDEVCNMKRKQIKKIDIKSRQV